MSIFQSFGEIEAWKESRILIREIRLICKCEAVQKDWPFADQITRTSRSIAANIADGNDSLTTSEFISFLGFSKRSTAEVRAYLYDALDEKYISSQEFDILSNQTKKICAMLAKLIHYLQSLHIKTKRTAKTLHQ